MDEQRIREIVREVVREELAALKTAQPKELLIRTVIDPQIAENSSTIDAIAKAISERIIPSLNLHHEAVKNLYDVLDAQGLLSGQPSKEN